MPGGNRTGPMGMGPMTGRATGYCGGFGVPGYTNSPSGHGAGIGFGRGHGFAGSGRRWRNMFHATGQPGWMRFGAPYGYPEPHVKPDPEFEKQELKNRAEALQTELELIKKRLGEVETGSAAD